MSPHFLVLLSSLFALSSGYLGDSDGWAHLKLGMSQEETSEALGEPLIKSSGHGFELWIYDNSAEALFYGGPLVGWTSPTKANTVAKVVDVWQRKPGGRDQPFFILPRPMKRVERPRETKSEDSYQAPLYKIRS